MRQVSAWGQFWFDLSSLHRVQGGAIFTPLTAARIKRSYIAPNGAPRQTWRKPYFSMWIKWSGKSAVYVPIEGDTMTQMIRDGLIKTGCYNLRMKIALLAVLLEEIEYRLDRTEDDL